MWIQTLPSVMQANILNFLSALHSRFRSADLESLALSMLSTHQLDFWVARAVQDLLSKVSQSQKVNQAVEHRCSDSMGKDILPDWLDQYRHSHPPLLPWLPVRASIPEPNISKRLHTSSQTAKVHFDKSESKCTSPVKNNSQLNTQGNEAVEVIGLKTPMRLSEGWGRTQGENDVPVTTSRLLDDNSKYTGPHGKEETTTKSTNLELEEFMVAMHRPDFCSQAQAWRESWLETGPTTEDAAILRASADLIAILNIVKPWEMGDDALLRIIEMLMRKEDGFLWSAQITSYCLLPKLLSLEQPASRFLISAVLQASKIHPRAAVDALLIPLILCDQGLNTSQCDVINRTLKECLPDHHIVSFCEKIFFQNKRQQLPFTVPPPVEHSFLGRPLVWSDPVCTVVGNLLNCSISLDEEMLDGLANAFGEVVDKLSKSLKFSNLLLCFISNYGSSLKQHKNMLLQVAEKTHTFMTKSLLSKCSAL